MALDGQQEISEEARERAIVAAQTAHGSRAYAQADHPRGRGGLLADAVLAALDAYEQEQRGERWVTSIHGVRVKVRGEDHVGSWRCWDCGVTYPDHDCPGIGARRPSDPAPEQEQREASGDALRGRPDYPLPVDAAPPSQQQEITEEMLAESEADRELEAALQTLLNEYRLCSEELRRGMRIAWASRGLAVARLIARATIRGAGNPKGAGDGA